MLFYDSNSDKSKEIFNETEMIVKSHEKWKFFSIEINLLGVFEPISFIFYRKFPICIKLDHLHAHVFYFSTREFNFETQVQSQRIII